MTKRLLLAILIVVGAVFVPYWVGEIEVVRSVARYLWPLTERKNEIIMTWLLGVLAMSVAVIVIIPLQSAYKYIRYGSLLVVLFCCLSASGQIRNPMKEKNVIVAYYYDSAMTCITHVDTIYFNRPSGFDNFLMPRYLKDSTWRGKAGVNIFNGATMPTYAPMTLDLVSRLDTVQNFKLKSIYFK